MPKRNPTPVRCIIKYSFLIQSYPFNKSAIHPDLKVSDLLPLFSENYYVEEKTPLKAELKVGQNEFNFDLKSK